ncbi:MAG: cell wall metabolism sensor histidine kinase WalK [Clostridia bacterium]|nr:cell wall metabolism sensor histidine kinase WalK [Clostridia bacterium]
MFKSIQWKIILIFMILTLSVMIVVGTFLLQNISEYYHNDFATTLSAQTFTPKVTAELERAAASDDPIGEITELMNIYSVRMGIDSFRNYYILDGTTAEVLSGSDSETREVEITENIVFALDGKVGQEVDRSNRYMDFALPIQVDGQTRYIAYVIDSKEEVYDIIKNIFINILWALLFGLLISAFLGFILARMIILPISNLQIRAEEMANGDFGQKIEVRSNDEIAKLTGAFNDMASQIEKSLSDISGEKKKVETILAQMTDGIAAFDMEGSLVHLNIAAKNYLGAATMEEIEGFADFAERLGFDISLESLTYLEQNGVVARETKKDNRILKVLFAPYSDETEKNGGVIAVLQDITEQTKLEGARREFVANVSHELRTPITTIKSYAETILDMSEEDTPEKNFVAVIESEANRMARIVTDLLTLSRLDNGASRIEKRVFDLAEMTKGVAEKLALDAKNHGLEISFTRGEGAGEFFGDSERLEQVVTNIVSNAIKYTPEGGKISVMYKSLNARVYIVVSDNGIGIPERDLPRIFERFYRVDKARSRESGGTGLGLAIAKEFVEMHGGEIDIKSEENKGTIVTIALPMVQV